MGNKVSVIENRCSSEEIELRLWVPGTRPGRFKEVIRIGPGGKKKLRATAFSFEDIDPQESTMLMVYINGVYTWKYILPQNLTEYAKVTCDKNENGQVIVSGIRAAFNFTLCRRQGCAFFPCKDCFGGPEEEIA